MSWTSLGAIAAGIYASSLTGVRPPVKGGAAPPTAPGRGGRRGARPRRTASAWSRRPRGCRRGSARAPARRPRPSGGRPRNARGRARVPRRAPTGAGPRAGPGRRRARRGTARMRPARRPPRRRARRPARAGATRAPGSAGTSRAARARAASPPARRRTGTHSRRRRSPPARPRGPARGRRGRARAAVRRRGRSDLGGVEGVEDKVRTGQVARVLGLVAPEHDRVGPGHHQRALREAARSEEHTSELQSRQYLVCRLLLEKKKNKNKMRYIAKQNDENQTQSINKK